MAKCLDCRAHLSKNFIRCRRCGRLLPSLSRRRIFWTTVVVVTVFAILLLYWLMPDTAVAQHVVVGQ